MTYEAWLRSVPTTITGDTLWNFKVYRMALYVSDFGWDDATSLIRDQRTRALSDQLYRAIGSIGANIAEGYSRGSGRDRVRFLEYALGSARESRDWYYKARHVLGSDITTTRLDLISQIIRLLLVMIPDQRTRSVSEMAIVYEPNDGAALT